MRRPAPPRKGAASIVVPRLYEGGHAYILQNEDRRIVFAIPYERDFTLIGTTDKPFVGDPSAPPDRPGRDRVSCAAINRYFAHPIGEAGHRPQLFGRAPAVRRRRGECLGGERATMC